MKFSLNNEMEMDENIKINASKYEWLNTILNNRWYRHALYWFFWVIISGIYYSKYNAIQNSILTQTVMLPFRMAPVYIIIYYLVPKYIISKRFDLFIGYTFLVITLAGIITRYFYVNYTSNLPFVDQENSHLFDIPSIVKTTLFIPTALLGPLMFKLFKIWHINKMENQTLLNEKLDAELKALRNQLQPHFLFNTLNSLYSQILKKSDEAEIIVIKLSELLRYMLYEANTFLVNLNKEILYMENYIELEKIRYGDRVKINYNKKGDFESYQISPMLLINFIENSFKHGVSNSDFGKIIIDIKVEDDILFFRCENTYNLIEDNNERGITSGIGIKNVKLRLEKIFKNNYELIINEDNNIYTVDLKISLLNNIKIESYEDKMSYSR